MLWRCDMAESKYYYLADKKRLFKYPFKLKEVGWLPNHFFVHRNAVLDGIYICMSCNSAGDVLTERDGIIQFSKPVSGKIHFSLLEPGTRLNTIKTSVHDELFFRFDNDSAQVVHDLVGKYTDFFFSNWPNTKMAELQKLLHQLDVPGVADKIDQLAVQLVSEVILQHIEQTELEKNTFQMRIFSVANDLVNGVDLPCAVKKSGFSKRSFYREWNKHFDLSPKDYIMQKKLEKACQMLLETDLKNIEIAERCGFENVKYLYLWFRKVFASSPGEYRRKNKMKLL